MDKHYVSNKDESVRLFKNDLLEMFTHVHWSVPMILYVPAIVFFLLRPSAASGGSLALAFVGGILVWTLTEYVMHRFVFHYQPRTSWGQTIHFFAHGVHHDYPNDSKRLVMPPSVSVPLAVLFYGMFFLIIPDDYLPTFFAGFLSGYVCYDTLHYATHHAPMKTWLGHWLKHHHLRHHYLNEDRAFGVSSPLWDYVFKTTHRARERAQDPKS